MAGSRCHGALVYEEGEVMGCYDTVIITCPACGEKIPYQTKAYICELKEWPLESAPTILIGDIEWSMELGNFIECPRCEKKLIVSVQKIATVSVKK